MPIRLTSREYRVIAIVAVVVVLSFLVSVKYFWRAFPEASIDFRVNRAGSEKLADTFLRHRGFKMDGYRHAVIFDFNETAKLYLERTQGQERLNELTQGGAGPIRIWRWSHRWFKPLEKEEFGVEITPTGQLVGF